MAVGPAATPLEQEGIHLLQHTVGSFFSEYGWYILFGLIAIFLLVQRLAKSFRGTSRSHLDTTAVAYADMVTVLIYIMAEAAVTIYLSLFACPEPDAVVRRQEALLAARMRMQEELNAQAEKFREKQRKLEEEKRKQKIAMWESMQEGKSYKETFQQNQEPEPGASTSAAVPKPKPKRKPLRTSGEFQFQVITLCLEKAVGLVHGDQDAEAPPPVDEASAAGVFTLTLAGIN
ncbi:Selenoprotein S [Varanus komodoensis]|nr:Selenoprotein S [Varanus komodoensis]